jgi:hypothetical protein
VGAVDVTRGVVVVAVTSAALTGLQLAVFSPLRIEGVVIMLVWLWPLALGLTGATAFAVGAGAFTGLLFDAHTATPFGLTALVGALLAVGVSYLAREGIGHLDGAAWWVAPAILGAGGLLAPPMFVALGAISGHASMWQGSLVVTMVVNALAFVLLARPLARAAASLARFGGFARG